MTALWHSAGRAALTLSLLAAAGPALAEGAPDLECARYADEFVRLAPGLDAQTGVADGAALMASGDRWPLVTTGFAYAAERIEKHDHPAKWGPLLIAADGLMGCFRDDPAEVGGEMAKVQADFEAVYPPARRKALLAQAKG
ncbi:hypothetical protein DRW48_15420 [Paracoccus suum]|uniref:Uncharacterized protein n=1 Tax=Paracoccus suum TaxID=2259340 RepID=A0A344PNC8_9RHOB|nr:hypothetical protein [Paracoccus suum]AXC50883.1 hypothetical protein DRW48_15420 [Paracoccus suum]